MQGCCGGRGRGAGVGCRAQGCIGWSGGCRGGSRCVEGQGFLGFKVSGILRFLISWFSGFWVSKFLGFKKSIACFQADIDPILKIFKKC